MKKKKLSINYYKSIFPKFSVFDSYVLILQIVATALFYTQMRLYLYGFMLDAFKIIIAIALVILVILYILFLINKNKPRQITYLDKLLELILVLTTIVALVLLAFESGKIIWGNYTFSNINISSIFAIIVIIVITLRIIMQIIVLFKKNKSANNIAKDNPKNISYVIATIMVAILIPVYAKYLTDFNGLMIVNLNIFGLASIISRLNQILIKK